MGRAGSNWRQSLPSSLFCEIGLSWPLDFLFTVTNPRLGEISLSCQHQRYLLSKGDYTRTRDPVFVPTKAGFDPGVLCPFHGRTLQEVGNGGYYIVATGEVGIGNPFLGRGGPRGIQLAAKFAF